MSALVSAIIPTKNRADLLERALDSVIDQTYENIEIIVVNDASTDHTSNLLAQYKQNLGTKLSVVENERSVGAAQARNQAIEAASGEFIAGLDDDDIWHPKRIEKLVAAHSDEYACVTSDTVMAHPGGKLHWKKKKTIDLETLLYTNQVGNQVLVRRDRLIDVGGFDEDLVAAQDYDLWVRLSAKYGPVKNVKKPLQTIFMDHNEDRITDRSSFRGYMQFYHKHKHRFDRNQRKYQLYKIRRAQQKPESIAEFISYVPAFRYWKELKRILKESFWT